MSALFSSKRKTILVFDRFFRSFVQRLTHVQNISISVYYQGLYVLPRRIFSLSVSLDLAELAFIHGNVCSRDERSLGESNQGTLHSLPCLHTTASRPLFIVFCIKSNYDGDNQPRRARGAVHHCRGTSELGTRDLPQSRMSPIALSPLTVMLCLSMGPQAML